jgi:hypothetical protein
VYKTQEIWVTGLPEATLEAAALEINHQILQCMTKFMTSSLIFKTPCHKPAKTDIHLYSSLEAAQQGII